MLRISSLSAGYGHIEALSGIDLQIAAGEFVSVLGPNGAGKSTLLKTIAGVVAPKSGCVLLEGRDLSNVTTAERIRLGIGVIPEGRQLFPDMSVRNNLVLGAYSRLKLRVDGATETALDQVYAMFPRLQARHRQLAGSLSGGEAQMLAIGRALMARPRLLLCDEPSLGLAPGFVRDMMATLRRLRDGGMTVMLADQNALAALSISDRGYVLDTGRVVAAGTAQELLRDKQLRETYLGAGAGDAEKADHR